MRRTTTPLILLAVALLLLLAGATDARADTTSSEAAPAERNDPIEPIDPIADATHPLDGELDEDVPGADEASGEPRIAHGRRGVRRVRRVRRVPHHHHSHRTVVVTRAASPSEPRVLARPPRDSTVSAGLRFTAVSLGDTELGNETFHGATLGGIGGYIRAKFLSHLGMEFSVDVMGNFDGDYDQLTIPVLVGLMGHIFPDSKLDIYGIIGGGVLVNAIDYQAVEVKGGGSRSFSESYLQLAGHVGAGLELDIGALELTTDLRYLLLQARPERSAELQAAVPMEVGGSSDEVTHGLQFMIGLGGNF